MILTADGRLLDASGNGCDARLHGSAIVETTAGPLDREKGSGVREKVRETPSAKRPPDRSGKRCLSPFRDPLSPFADPHGGGALVLGPPGGYAEAPAEVDLGPGNFTLAAWIWKAAPGSGIILSKGNGFGDANQWSWGWEKEGVPGSISLRVNNEYFPTAADSVPLYRWVHVAFVRRGDTGQGYVDGRPSGPAHDMTRVGSLVNDRPLRIGRRAHDPNPAYFRGKIGPVQILPAAPVTTRPATATPPRRP
jgi:hypothetical protein